VTTALRLCVGVGAELNSYLHLVASPKQTNSDTNRTLPLVFKQLAVTYMEPLAANRISMQRFRLGELARRWFRNERVFEHGCNWYFRTREGIDVGPYPTRFEAEIEADILIARLAHESIAQSNGIIQAFILESMQQDDAGRDNADIGALLPA